MDLPGENTAKEVLLQTGRQNGVLGIIAIILILAVLGGIWAVGAAILPVAKRFIESAAVATESNAAAITSVNESLKTVHQAHAAMMQANTLTQTAVGQNGAKIDSLSENIEQMAAIVREAKVLMSAVPQQRAEQTRLLEQIDEAIRELSNEIRRTQEPGPN